MKQYERSLDEVQNRKKELIRVSFNKHAVTLDGIEISVMANVRSREDVELALEGGADGIGLFRTEPFFLSAKHFPSEKEFAKFLIDSLHSARGKHIDVRLLDIGADKNPIYLHLPPEPDPFLGRRGVRVLLEYPELLDAQLRAVLEVSQQFPIGVLIPMVTTAADAARVTALVQSLAVEMGIRELPRIGAMIETPAAALSVPSLKNHVDFFSIGSNDLTQYTMAAGRENPLVTEYFIDDHPAVLRLIELVVKNPVTRPYLFVGSLRAGSMPSLTTENRIRSLSVAAALVPEVKIALWN